MRSREESDTHAAGTLALRALTSILFIAMVGFAAWDSSGSAQDNRATLRLSIVDASSGKPVPARVELLAASGKPYIAEDALLVGQGYRDRRTAWKGTIEQALALLSTRIENPYTQTVQFQRGLASRRLQTKTL